MGGPFEEYDISPEKLPVNEIGKAGWGEAVGEGIKISDFNYLK